MLCQSNAKLQKTTTTHGRAANSAQHGPQLRLMQLRVLQSGTLSFNGLTGRGVGFTRHTAHNPSITARKIYRCVQFSHRKQAAARDYRGHYKALRKIKANKTFRIARGPQLRRTIAMVRVRRFPECLKPDTRRILHYLNPRPSMIR